MGNTRPVITEEDRVRAEPYYAPRISPAAIPGPDIWAEPVACVRVSRLWVPHLLGALAVLDQPDTWEGTESEIWNARQQVRELMVGLMGACEETGDDVTIKYARLTHITGTGLEAGATSPGWQQIPLNTLYNPDGIVTPGLPAFSLAPGSYRARISVAAYRVGHTRGALYGSGGGGRYVVLGSSEMTAAADKVMVRSVGVGEFEVTDPDEDFTFVLFAEQSHSAGMGVPVSDGENEIYSFVELFQL